MDLPQPKSTPRWYELAPYGAAFFAGLALALMALQMIEPAVGRQALDRWGIWFALGGAMAAGHWGRRLPRRVLVVALVLFWLIDFWLIAHAT